MKSIINFPYVLMRDGMPLAAGPSEAMALLVTDYLKDKPGGYRLLNWAEAMSVVDKKRPATNDQRYPHMRIHVEVRDQDDNTIVEYLFWLNDKQARDAFAARCKDAWAAGQTILTYQEVGNDHSSRT